MSGSDRLAVDGGRPARDRPDEGPVARLGAGLLGAEERQAADAVLRARVLYRHHGSQVAEFEDRFAAWLGADAGGSAPLALAVNSGSSAIQLALAAAGVGPGDEVVVPTVGFVSAATTVIALGATPRFVPCDASLGLDSKAAAAVAGERTRALLAVHPFGSACAIEASMTLAAEAGAVVVEDVAQACGATLGGRRLGTFGDLAAFSFQQFKLIATGEGGMVTAKEPGLIDRARFSHDAAAWWTTPDAARAVETATAPSNLRMSELEGAIGIVQLGRCDGLIERLRSLSAPLRERVVADGRFRLRPEPDAAGAAGTHLVFDAGASPGAVRVAEALRAEGVRAGALIGEPAGNRHWAGDWEPILRRCGAKPPDSDVVARDRELIGQTVVVQVDPAWTEADLMQTAAALGKIAAAL